VIALLEQGGVTHVSLDHDLGDDQRGTGYDVILWIEEAVALKGFTPPALFVHSANSSAREKCWLESALSRPWQNEKKIEPRSQKFLRPLDCQYPFTTLDAVKAGTFLAQ
jgi:hypothetical protein